jgi:hypothetical protein
VPDKPHCLVSAVANSMAVGSNQVEDLVLLPRGQQRLRKGASNKSRYVATKARLSFLVSTSVCHGLSSHNLVTSPRPTSPPPRHSGHKSQCLIPNDELLLNRLKAGLPSRYFRNSHTFSCFHSLRRRDAIFIAPATTKTPYRTPVPLTHSLYI